MDLNLCSETKGGKGKQGANRQSIDMVIKEDFLGIFACLKIQKGIEVVLKSLQRIFLSLKMQQGTNEL